MRPRRVETRAGCEPSWRQTLQIPRRPRPTASGVRGTPVFPRRAPCVSMMATIPVFMALAEIVFLRTQRLTLRLGVALLVGIGGVVILVGRSMSMGEAPIDTAGEFALIVAAISWSVAATLSRKMPLDR